MATTILSHLSEKFDKAGEAGDLLFFPSEIHHHEERGVEFEIRLCPALQKKPALPTPHFDAGLGVSKSKDPFAPPYIPGLFLGELKDEEEEYVLLLNKYSVVPKHFLLVTKDFQSQSTPLTPCDLVQAYLLLDAARKTGGSYFAFYNCGENSGASQPHKHLQFIPVEDDGPPVEKLAKVTRLEDEKKPFRLSALPYANHVRRLPALSSSTQREILEDVLRESFISLLDLTISSIRHDPTYPAGSPSYNVILTLEHMHLIPRKLEDHVLSETGDKLSVNALGFAGMLLVKSETELEAVKKEGVGKILRAVGVESVHEQQILDAHEDDRNWDRNPASL